MIQPPKETPRCSCGDTSKWDWDPYDEAWYETHCFRCTEIAAMKGELWALIVRPLDTNQMDRFIEIVTDRTVLSPNPQVKEFKR